MSKIHLFLRSASPIFGAKQLLGNVGLREPMRLRSDFVDEDDLHSRSPCLSDTGSAAERPLEPLRMGGGGSPVGRAARELLTSLLPAA
jgi:hypothetical protein